MSGQRTMVNDQGGSIAVASAVALAALLMAIGVAIDYARGFSTHTLLQAELDKALLAAAPQATNAENDSDAQALIEKFLDMERRGSFQAGPVRLTVIAREGELAARASVKVPTVLMQLFGIDEMEVAVDSAVTAVQGAADIALVLDSTESMVGPKLDGVKAAASNLIDEVLGSSPTQGLVRMSIVPFASYINVGLANRNAWWLKDSQDYTNVQHIDGYTSQVGVGCIAGTERTVDQIVGYKDGVPIIQPMTLCDPERYETINIPGYDVVTNYVWNGCVSVRPYPVELEDGSYDVHKVQGMTDPHVKCPSEIKPLSNDVDDLKAAISSLAAKGDTYIPSGILWGQRVLSEQEPFDEAAASKIGNGTKPRKILVIMSDGQNTVAQGDYWQHQDYDESIWLEHRGAEDINRANSVTEQVCARAKASGIEIVVVGFEVPTQTARSLLRQCASKYYEAQDVSELSARFEQIASSFSKLRLTR